MGWPEGKWLPRMGEVVLLRKDPGCRVTLTGLIPPDAHSRFDGMEGTCLGYASLDPWGHFFRIHPHEAPADGVLLCSIDEIERVK